MKNVLIINAHQFYQGISSGTLNKTIEGVVKDEMENRGYEMQQTYIE